MVKRLKGFVRHFWMPSGMTWTLLCSLRRIPLMGNLLPRSVQKKRLKLNYPGCPRFNTYLSCSMVPIISHIIWMYNKLPYFILPVKYQRGLAIKVHLVGVLYHVAFGLTFSIWQTNTGRDPITWSKSFQDTWTTRIIKENFQRNYFSSSIMTGLKTKVDMVS